MAIVKMKKFTLLAFESQKEDLLRDIQKFEGVEFININEVEENDMKIFSNKDKQLCDYTEFIDKQAKIRFALDYLSKYIPQDKGIKALIKGKKILSHDELKNAAENSNWLEKYNELKTIEEELNFIKNEISKLNQEKDVLQDWLNLDVSRENLDSLKDCSSHLGIVRGKDKSTFINTIEVNIEYCHTEIISEDSNSAHVLMIVHKEQENRLIELMKNVDFTSFQYERSKTPKEIIIEINDIINKYSSKKEEHLNNIQKFENLISHFEILYDYYETEKLKAESMENFLNTGKIIAIQGWTASESEQKLEKIINAVTKGLYHIEFEEAKEDEKVPILLRNNSFVEAFEPVTAMYSFPSYTEVDPTPVLAPFLLIFFGMMLSDAGYGLIMVVATTYALLRVPLEKSQIKIVKLFLYLGVSTIFFGVLFGSYFGDALKEIIPQLKPLWIDPSADPIKVLLLSAAMGVVHLYVGLGVKAYILIKKGSYLDALYDVGFWYMTLTGSFMILLNLGSFGKYIAIIGAVGLVATQGRSNKGFAGKIGGGIFGLYGITGYLGDILSYSRLLALGLATGLIGSSFNLMIRLLGDGIIAYIFGAVIFIGGHVFNLLINALGAYVHSARLQYLEFFNKFYEGGGKEFNPLKSSNKYIIIKNK